MVPNFTRELLEYIDLNATDSRAQDLSAEESAILDRVNQKVAAAESVEAIIDFIFDATHSLYPCDRVGLAFLEEEGQRVVAHYAHALYEPMILKKGYTEDMRDSSLEKLMEGNNLRLIHDLEKYLAAKPESRSSKLLLREGVRASMTCPVMVDGRKIGFLFRSAREPGAYSARQGRLHQAIAERLSQAVEKAYRIEQLDAANKAYMEMLGFVSHELKSPVASMVTDAKLILGGFLGPVDPKHADKLERMVKKADYLLNLVREYLDLARIEGGQLEINSVPDTDLVAEVIEPTLDILKSQVESSRAEVEQDFPVEGIKVACDPDQMKIVMINLIGNAVKYGNDRGKIKIKVESRNERQKRVRVSVWNEGPGFPPEQRANLFKKFSRLNTPELLKRKGSGVGLYSTWRIIQLHGGRIWADSEVGNWAEFSFEIPIEVPVEE